MAVACAYVRSGRPDASRHIVARREGQQGDIPLSGRPPNRTPLFTSLGKQAGTSLPLCCVVTGPTPGRP